MNLATPRRNWSVLFCPQVGSDNSGTTVNVLTLVDLRSGMDAVIFVPALGKMVSLIGEGAIL